MKNWNPHDHRVELRISDHATIYHPDHGQLCWCETHWDCNIYHPFCFCDKAAAAQWIKEGTIAQLQEGMSNLKIGFTTKNYEQRT